MTTMTKLLIAADVGQILAFAFVGISFAQRGQAWAAFGMGCSVGGLLAINVLRTIRRVMEDW